MNRMPVSTRVQVRQRLGPKSDWRHLSCPRDKDAQLIAVRSLLEDTAFAFEDREAVAGAVTLFEAGSCGLADCLVVAKHARQGCDFTATFDRSMRKLPGVKIL